MSEDKTISRRSFLATATWTIGGLISAGLAIPAIAYIVGPALKSESAKDWMLLGSVTKIELGTPTLFKIKS